MALEAALAELGECFSSITGQDGERRAGQTYAGRTLVYEDTVRGVRISLGPQFREQLAKPLSLFLDSARWLVAQIGEEYDELFRDCYRRRVAQTGDPVVPLAGILSLATPQLFYNTRQLSQPVRRAVAKFQQRWAEILQVPADAREVRLDSDELADRVAELFPRRPLPWATAIHHSPDFMLAAEDAAAVEPATSTCSCWGSCTCRSTPWRAGCSSSSTTTRPACWPRPRRTSATGGSTPSRPARCPGSAPGSRRRRR